MAASTAAIKVADEIWIATALLHREHPERAQFSTEEIRQRIRREQLNPEFRAGAIAAHLSTHMVASEEPDTGGYAMLHKDGRGIRLYKPGDPLHPRRTGKTHPTPEDIPPAYRHLVDWYKTEYCGGEDARFTNDPILRLRGLGKHVWRGIDPDVYVDSLRSGWE
jgi:hypothetical protein